MSIKDEIIKVYIRNNNEWMSSESVYNELNKYVKWGKNKRGHNGHKNMVNRDLSSRYISIFEKDTSSKPNKYRIKEKMLLQYKYEISKMEEVKRIDKILDINKNLKLEGKEREALVKVRVNQGIFRSNLINLDCRCKICGLNIENLLIASHSKGWKDSNKYEKLDTYNGFLLCPNHDSLYDKHLITFDDNGYILISKSIDKINRNLLRLDKDIKVKLLQEQKKYVKFHRIRFYEKEKLRNTFFLN